MKSYLDDLDVVLAQQPGFKAPPLKELTQIRTTSTTDSECGYIRHGTKRGILGALPSGKVPTTLVRRRISRFAFT